MPNGTSRQANADVTPDAAGAGADADTPHVSGVRRALRVPRAPDGLISALADATDGRLLDEAATLEAPSLEPFAAALPELFETAITSHALEAGRLERELVGGLQDLVLVSPARVHVAQRLLREPRKVLLSVAERGTSIGWVVSQARSELDRR